MHSVMRVVIFCMVGSFQYFLHRYDCRGHLYSRDEFEWKSSQLTMQLSPEEEQIEKACEEERYMGIHKDVEEENFLEGKLFSATKVD